MTIKNEKVNDSLPVMMHLHGVMSGANGAKQRQLQKRFKGRYRVIAPELYADPAERIEVEQMTEEISKNDHNMLDPENDDVTMLKVALKGSKEALATAYRRSIRMLAEYDKEFGTESQPDDLDFRWEWIKDYRVLIVITNGAGIHGKFDDIEGITECLWAIYDDYSMLYASNDREGILLNDRATFGIPEGRFEIE